MRFVLHSIGSTGDILPFVALGHHLKQDGHSVVAGFDPNAGAIAKSVGLKYAPVGPSPDFAQATNILLSMSKIADEAEHWDKFLQSMTGGLQAIYADLLKLCQDADCLIACPYNGVPQMVHEKTGIPLVTIMPFDFPEEDSQVRAVWSSRVNKFRSQLGFNETAVPWGDGEGRRLLSLYSMSPGLTGRSVEEAPGFFFLPSSPSFQPSPELDAFLTEGEPAVVVTLGSMMVANSESTMRLLIDAVAPSGRRLVVQRGWAFLWREFDFLPPFVIMIDNVPHEWLFPRASVVIHHGGAGTTAACLRAGVPSIIIPFIFDHGFWAARTLAYGSTSGILPYRELSAEKLSHLLLDTFSRYSHYRAHALRAASMVRQEPGVAAAARQISEALTANLATRPGR